MDNASNCVNIAPQSREKVPPSMDVGLVCSCLHYKDAASPNIPLYGSGLLLRGFCPVVLKVSSSMDPTFLRIMYHVSFGQHVVLVCVLCVHFLQLVRPVLNLLIRITRPSES